MTKEIIKFNGDLGIYQAVATEDGSYTLWSEYFNENCHSTSGAVDETLYNYIKGCEVEKRLQDNQSLTLFEVGLGVGIGPKLTIDLARNSNCSLTFISTELDEGLVKWVKNNQSDQIFKELERKIIEDLIYYESKIDNIRLIVLVGDAREAIRKSDILKFDLFNGIYQDAFSPKKNPTLWTKQWFEELRKRSASNCILSTYSSSNAMRKALHMAGWNVINRTGFKMKRKATLALNEGETSAEVLDSLLRSPLTALED